MKLQRLPVYPFGALRPLYGSYRTANLQMHFIYLFNKYPYWMF